MKRRDFIKASFSTIVSFFSIFSSLIIIKKVIAREPISSSKRNFLRPPGALPEPDFLASCIRCNRCIDVCPSQAIQHSSHSSPVPAWTPYIIPGENACILCLNCTKVCPTDALKVLNKKEEVKIGVARIDKRLCVAHNGSGICGACHTACPLKNEAIKLGHKTKPTVDDEKCTGCGQCEIVCPSKGTKAIKVEPIVNE